MSFLPAFFFSLSSMAAAWMVMFSIRAFFAWLKSGGPEGRVAFVLSVVSTVFSSALIALSIVIITGAHNA